MKKILVVLVIFSSLVFSISLKDLDKLDRLDKSDYIQEANNEDFKKSYALLKEASILGLDTSTYDITKKYIKKKEKAYYARIERQRQARLKKQREEKARLARIERQQESYSSSGGSSYSLKYGCKFSCTGQ